MLKILGYLDPRKCWVSFEIGGVVNIEDIKSG